MSNELYNVLSRATDGLYEGEGLVAGIFGFVGLFLCSFVCLFVYLFVRMCVLVCACVCACLCVCACVRLYA